MHLSKKRVIVFFALVSFLLNSFVYGQEGRERLINIPNGKEMTKICVREGATNVVNGFDERAWDALGERVATGDPDWVEASACLMQDFSFSVYEYRYPNKEDLGDYANEVLRHAWREVLLKKPETLLEFGERISFKWACGYPYDTLLDDAYTVEWADDYLEQGLAALAQVKNEYLQTERKVCEIYLRDIHKFARKEITNRNERG